VLHSALIVIAAVQIRHALDTGPGFRTAGPLLAAIIVLDALHTVVVLNVADASLAVFVIVAGHAQQIRGMAVVPRWTVCVFKARHATTGDDIAMPISAIFVRQARLA